MNMLIVEGEIMFRGGLVDSLRAAGHNFDAAGDGLIATKRGLRIGGDDYVMKPFGTRTV